MFIINNKQKLTKENNMNKLKKIGLTALAGSLVATSVAYAGALEATGSAEMKVENNSASSAGKTIGMANNIYFKGSGETDSGLNVAVSFELDDGSSSGNASGVWDNHSVSVGNDTVGTVTVHGHGGSSAVTALDTTAAGDLWDNGSLLPAANAPTDSGAGNNVVVYALPSLIDDVALSLSYASDGTRNENSIAYSLGYTGVEGLSVSFGYAENKGTVNVKNEQLVTKASYAVGPITAGYSINQVEKVGANSLTVSSMSLSYSLTDSLSLSYGEETFERSTKATDIEVSGISGSYTSGGMVLALKKNESKNNDHTSTSTNNDPSYWQASLSFAF
jgi:outer membrane protein OmpU